MYHWYSPTLSEIVHGCADLRVKRQSAVTTANAIYGCEELEDAASIYDDIEDNHYDDSNEQNVYLVVLGDENEGCDVPELPSPRPEQDYAGLTEQNPEHEYLHVLNAKTEENDENTEAEDQNQNQDTEQQEKA